MASTGALDSLARWSRPPLTPDETQELSARAKAGDAVASWEMVRSVVPLLIRLVRQRRNLTSRALEPADLVQHLVQHIATHVGAFDPDKGSFYGWARFTARTALTREIRRGTTIKIPNHVWSKRPGDASRASHCRDLDGPATVDADNLLLHEVIGDESAIDPELELGRQDVARQVQSAIGELPERDQPLARARLEGKSWQDLGEQRGVSRQAAWQRGARVESRLRRRLQSCQ